MYKLQFNANASAEIITVKDYSSLAEATVDFIQKGFVAISGGSTYSRLFLFGRRLSRTVLKHLFFRSMKELYFRRSAEQLGHYI